MKHYTNIWTLSATMNNRNGESTFCSFIGRVDTKDAGVIKSLSDELT